MRKAERIDEFCDRLKEEWKKVPDWRFGQFICNTFSYVSMDERVSAFYVEDDRMMELIEEFMHAITRDDTESHI